MLEASLIDVNIQDRLELEKELALLLRWKQITGNQYATLFREIEPHLPALVIVDMKTKKGLVKVLIVKPNGAIKIHVNNRAKVI